MLMRELLNAACCHKIPKHIPVLEGLALKSGFDQTSQTKTGVLLRTLAASKPRGKLLELGTGAGHSAAWILDGMDTLSTLTSVDKDGSIQKIAQDTIDDPRVKFVTQAAGEFMLEEATESYDLIFADAWEGKYSHLDTAIGLLKRGGFYIVDDMLPQPNWPEGQKYKVPLLQQTLPNFANLTLLPLDFGTGYIVAVKTYDSSH